MTPSAAALLTTFTAEEIEAWDAEYEANPLFRYFNGQPGQGGMSPGQERFHAKRSQYRALRAANQCGKTVAGAAEAWAHSLGCHPFRPTMPVPTEGWIVMPDLDNDWPKISAALRLLEPPGVLAAGCRYDPATGYTYRSKRMVMLANGSQMVPKSGTQQILALAGRSIDWLWIDEPPKKSHWGEAIARVSVKEAPVWLTFTPIGRPLGWLRTLMEGDDETETPPNPAWANAQVVIELSYANAPHRTRASIDTQIANCDPWEVGQRIRGEWDGLTPGRKFANFTEACILDPDDLPEEYDELRLGIDHGEGAGKQVAYLEGVRFQKYYLIGEYVGKAHSTPHEDGEGIYTMLRSCGASVFDIARAFGDINSAGKLGAGGKMNEFLERAITAAAKLSKPPFAIERPAKGAGSVAAGEKAMGHAMKEGRWFVSSKCTAFIHSAKHYTGREKDLKDPIDGARYGVADLLLAGGSLPTSPTLVL